MKLKLPVGSNKSLLKSELLATLPTSGRTDLRMLRNDSSYISTRAWYNTARLQTVLGFVLYLQ